MPKVTFVKKARKDNPAVKAGESYYWWSFRFGGKHYSKTPPRPSQLTQSDKLGRFYAAQEMVEDACAQAREDHDLEALRDAIGCAADEVREVGEEYQESCDNIRDSFEDSPTADECEEKAERCSDIADELESVDLDVDNEPQSDDLDFTQPVEDAAHDANNDPSLTPQERIDAIAEAQEQADEAYEQAHDEWVTAIEQAIDEAEAIDFDLY